MRITALLLIICLLGCNKDKSCESCVNINAIVTYAGPLAGDGCEWNIVTSDNNRFYPDNLPENFKEEQLSVHITYTLTADTFHCGIAGTGIPIIHLLSIRK